MRSWIRRFIGPEFGEIVSIGPLIAQKSLRSQLLGHQPAGSCRTRSTASSPKNRAETDQNQRFSLKIWQIVRFVHATE